jgi:hypothetical protein
MPPATFLQTVSHWDDGRGRTPVCARRLSDAQNTLISNNCVLHRSNFRPTSVSRAAST